MRTLAKFLSIAILAMGVAPIGAQNRIAIPDIDGYKTLQCDFHIHTVFSDGLVWPTVRVDEAWREGLDAISLTEHLEYRPFSKDVVSSHGRSYEIAEPAAANRNLLLIRGSEITRGMPPGHFNAIFLTDCDALAKEDWRESFAEAKKQNAFIFWNHPSWKAQQPDTTRWFAEHTEILDNGWMQGIEVVNGNGYSKEAHQWCIDKNLTMLGTTDAHAPIQNFTGSNHRTMTLVLATDRTQEAIREALDNRRTVVYFGQTLIGEERYLNSIFENSIGITSIDRTGTGVTVAFTNYSDLTFKLKRTTHDPEIVYFDEYEITPRGRHTVTFEFPANKRGEVNFEITNLLVRPGKGLDISLPLQ